MSNDINLVLSRSDEIEKEKKILRFLRIIAGGFLVLIAFFSIGIFIINISVPISEVRKEQQETLSAITNISKKVAVFHYKRDRISNISGVLQERKDYPNSLNEIFTKSPSSLVVESFKIENKVLTLSFSDTSLLALNEAIETLVSFSSGKKIISDLVIDSLEFNPTSGRYSLTFRANVI